MYSFGQHDEDVFAPTITDIHAPLSMSDPSFPSMRPPGDGDIGPSGNAILAFGGSVVIILWLAGIIGPILAYHGYKRNDSVVWGLVWLLSGALWPIMLPVALVQGFAKPE